MIFGLAFVAVERSQPAHSPGYPQDTKETERAAGKQEAGLWEKTTSDPTAFYTFLLVVVTAALAGVSVIQAGFLLRTDKTARISADAAHRAANAAAQQNRISDSSLRLNRAWMTFDSFNTFPMLEHPLGRMPMKEGLAIQGIWHNSGITPARNVTAFQNVTLRAELQSADRTPIVSQKESAAPIGLIGPNKTLSSPLWVFNDHELAAFRRDGATALLYAKVTYFDVFDPDIQRHTEIAIELSCQGSVVDKRTGQTSLNVQGRVLGSQSTAS